MAYPLGSVVTLTWSKGTQTTAVVTVTLPDGTAATPTVTETNNAGTYSYSATYVPTVPGRFVVRWVGTGSNPGAAPLDMFNVVASNDAPLVSLADLRSHLNWTTANTTANDAELMEMARSATEIVESYLGRPLRRKTVTETHSGGSQALLLYQVPCPCTDCLPGRVLTVTQVVENGTTLTASDYTLDVGTGLLYRGIGSQSWVSVQPGGLLYPALGGQWWISTYPGGISVTYTTGVTQTPSWASMAVKRLVEHLWRRSQQARPGSNAANTEGSPSPSYLLPYAVQTLIDPHRSSGL